MAELVFPEPEQGDSREVADTLHMASAQWVAGAGEEAVRSIRHAAQLAEAAGDDLRALALARFAADLTTIQEQQLETAAGASSPQLSRPPKPGLSASANGAPVASAAGVTHQPSTPAPPSPTNGGLRVAVKRSATDGNLLVARILEAGRPPPGYKEARIILVHPEDSLDEP